MASKFKDQEISSLKPTGRDLLNFMLENEEKILGKFLPVSAGTFGGKFTGGPNAIERLFKLIKDRKFPTASTREIVDAVKGGNKSGRQRFIVQQTPGDAFPPGNKALSTRDALNAATPRSTGFVEKPQGNLLKLASSPSIPLSNVRLVSNIDELFDKLKAIRDAKPFVKGIIKDSTRALDRLNRVAKSRPLTRTEIGSATDAKFDLIINKVKLERFTTQGDSFRTGIKSNLREFNRVNKTGKLTVQRVQNILRQLGSLD